MLKKLLALCFISIRLFGVIPTTSINNLYQPFDSIGKPYLNPTLGFIFSNRLADQLRKYGIYKSLSDDKGNRIYSRDQGLDGVFQLIRLLFPSTGGTLSTISTANDNFSNILNGGSSKEQINLIIEMLTNIDKLRQNQNQDQKCLDTDNKSSQAYNFPSKKRQHRNQCFKQLNEAILNAINLENTGFYPKYFVEQIILGFFWQQFNTIQDLEMLVNKMLSFFSMSSLKNDESNATSPFIPWKNQPFTLDKLHNLQTAMEQNPNILLNPEELLQLAYFPMFFEKSTPYINGENLISNGLSNPYQQTGTLDSQAAPFADCVETVIRQLTNIVFYDASRNQFDKDAILACKNPALEEFYGLNLNPKVTPNKPFQSLQAVNDGSISIRSAWNAVVADLNNPPGNIANDVFLPITYNRNGLGQKTDNSIENNNELASGFINIANVLSRILGKPLINKENYAKWIANPQESIDELQEIFQNLLNNNTVEISLTSESLEDLDSNRPQQDLYGSLFFTIGEDQAAQSFELYVISSHAQLYNNTPIRDDQQNIPLNNVELTHTWQSLKLLLPEWQETISLQAEPYVYNLYSQPMQDNFDKLAFLNKLVKIPVNSFIRDIKTTIYPQILNEIAWQDDEVVDQGWKTVLNLLKQKWPNGKSLDIPKTNNDFFNHNPIEHFIQEDIKSLSTMDKDVKSLGLFSILDCRYIPTLSNFSKLERLKIYNLPELKSLPPIPNSVTEMEIFFSCSELKTIDLTYSNIKRLSLNHLPLLQTINLPQNLVELNIENCPACSLNSLSDKPKLQSLTLAKQHNINQLPELPNSLTELVITDCSKLNNDFINQLTINCPNLNRLTLNNINNLSLLSNLPNSLMELEINNCPNILWESLFQHPSLNKLISNSLLPFVKILSTQDSLFPKLRYIKFRRNFALDLEPNEEINAPTSENSQEP